MGEKIAYVRVSTIEQNEARQVEELKKHNIQKWFIEKYLARIPIGPNFKNA